ncbi:MAG TPA: pitrilysin family protein [Candidatus Limnocylindrales bacterium]|nr:pitrilysin family protein [Candidatus Limnocylindrales bacterium]
MTTGRATVIAERPVPGTPRPYEFPTPERTTLANGIAVAWVHMPGRGLVTATFVTRQGAVDEPAELGGAAVLAARAVTEGTELHDAIALVEAAERLGASIHAEASWDALTVGVDVPGARLSPALELLAEVLRRPTFPAAEVDRLRDERLNDILQARADPRRRAEEALIAAVYAVSSPYRRPAAGLRETVERLDREAVASVYSGMVDPGASALVIAGDLAGLDVPVLAGSLFGDIRRPAVMPSAAHAGTAGSGPAIDDRPLRRDRRVRVHHRPGSVQTEIRIGHPGVPRRHPDFHALSVMSSILGGLFNSRLNMKLREEKGYTYGASTGFDMRRGAGPFVARAAVNTEATVPAIQDTLAELERIRDGEVSDAELRAARDYLIGVFPLRFETPGPVAGALAGVHIHELPDDELSRYRTAIETVTAADVLRVAREHIRPEEAAVVLVGDHDAFGDALHAASIAPVEVIEDSLDMPGGPEGGDGSADAAIGGRDDGGMGDVAHG